MICIVESAIESLQNKNTIILRLFATYIHVYYIIIDITIIIQVSDYFNKIIKINNYIFYVVRYM